MPAQTQYTEAYLPEKLGGATLYRKQERHYVRNCGLYRES